MRNTGWYIPYWRKSRKKGKAERPATEEITRSDEQLEAVRQRWVERYRRTLRALRLMGLSMGSSRGEVQARYEILRETGAVPSRELEEAYHHLMRMLPPAERRKRRRNENASANQGRDATVSREDVDPSADADDPVDADDADDMDADDADDSLDDVPDRSVGDRVEGLS